MILFGSFSSFLSDVSLFTITAFTLCTFLSFNPVGLHFKNAFAQVYIVKQLASVVCGFDNKRIFF